MNIKLFLIITLFIIVPINGCLENDNNKEILYNHTYSVNIESNNSSYYIYLPYPRGWPSFENSLNTSKIHFNVNESPFGNVLNISKSGNQKFLIKGKFSQEVNFSLFNMNNYTLLSYFHTNNNSTLHLLFEYTIGNIRGMSYIADVNLTEGWQYNYIKTIHLY